MPAAHASQALCTLGAGTFSNAAMMSMSGRVLSEKLDVLRLTFYTSPISCLCLLPFYYFREVHTRIPAEITRPTLMLP